MVPWQTNKTFIGISYLQNRIKLRRFAREGGAFLAEGGAFAPPLRKINFKDNSLFYREAFRLQITIVSSAFSGKL